MSYGNLALARDYFAEISNYEERVATVRTLDLALIRLYGLRAKPNSSGAMSHNRHAYQSISYQRYSLDLILSGLANDDIKYLKFGMMGFRYGFAMQESDGSFEISYLTRRSTDIGTRLSSAALFITSACIAYQLLYHSRYRHRMLKAIVELRLGIRRSLAWMAKNDMKLFLQDQDSAHHLINDALAFIIGGEIFTNEILINRGYIFLDIAIEMQRDDGSFMEYEGHDSSYQATSIIFLMYYLMFVNDKSYFLKVLKAIGKGVYWEKKRILPSGKVNSRQNTRRTKTYSTFSGRKSDINYSEVVKSMLLYTNFTGDKQSRILAQRVFKYIVNANRSK